MGFKNKFGKNLIRGLWGCGAETKDLILEDQKDGIRGCEELKYLGVKIYKRTHKKMILRTGLIKVEQ